MLLLHAAAAMGDFAALLAFPFQVDYGEGEVWQQAVLIGSSRAYTVSQAFPFIPFEYPPLYYGVVRAVACLIPDMLVAGRLVSEVSSLLIVPLVASLVLAGSRSARTAERVAIAVASGLLFLALHPTRSWGPLMRVDLLAVMLSLFGLLLGVRASGQFAGTAVALLVCLASVFTKQTELPAGLAVLAVAARINWRGALAAALVAGGAGLAIAAFLQHATGGGFLLNVVGYNMNRWSWSALLRLVWIERASMLVIVLAAISAVAVLRALRTGWASADEAAVTRAVIVLQFVLASFMLLELGKEGGSINYFLDALSSGCVLIGIALCGLNLTRPHLLTAALLLILAIGGRPLRLYPDPALADRTADLQPLAERIAASGKPVASDDMAVILRAGGQNPFEPFITGELSATGALDITPLVQIIREHRFAFMLTFEPDLALAGPLVTEAMRAAYPSVEPVAPGLWMHSR